MSTSIVPFQFESNSVRVVMIDGDPWFVARDIALALDYADPSKMLNLVDGEDKKTINPQDHAILAESLPSNAFRLSIVNESGVYASIFGSTKPEAKKFKKWITSEVLPAIRKTGSYSIASLSPAEQFLKIAEFMVDQERKAKELEAKLVLEAQRNDRLEEIVKQHDAELDRVFNPDGNFYTVRGYASLKGFNLTMSEAIALGRKATKVSKDLGYRKDEINDPRYGKVGAYSERVLEQIFD